MRGRFSACRGGGTRAAPGRSATPAMACPVGLARPRFPVADAGLSAISLRSATRVAPRVEPARPPMVGLGWVAAGGPSVALRVNLTDRSGQTGAVWYQYIGPVWPETGPNRLNSNLNSKAAVQPVRNGIPAGLAGLPVGLTGNRPNSIFFLFMV